MAVRDRIFVQIALLAALSAPVAASESDQLALPIQADFGCLACHSGPGATEISVPVESAAQLNEFGADWVAFGRVWGPAIAAANSDGDGCNNGYELGDPSGNWRPEDGYIQFAAGQVSNPGSANDCILPLDEQSFGVLKGLFGAKR